MVKILQMQSLMRESHHFHKGINCIMNKDFFDLVGTSNEGRNQAIARPVEDKLDEACETMTAEKMIVSSSASKSWAENGDAFWVTAKSHDKLPSGLYRCGHSDNIGPYLKAQRIDTDTLMVLPDTASEEIVEEVEEFQSIREEFHKRGFLHKRGILLWGPPGSGKTSTIQLLLQLIIQRNAGIAIYAERPGLTAKCLKLVRSIEPDRPIIVLMEDLDALVSDHGEAEFLSLLDGESQVDNVIYVGTTNYPERLDARFVDRPSRFDTIKYIGMPSAAARRCYLSFKEASLNDDEALLDEYVKRTDGFSIAHLRELIILTMCFKRPLDESVKRLEKFRVKPSSTKHPDSRGFGFAG